MHKYILFFIFFAGTFTCSAHDMHDYMLNPQLLQRDLTVCPGTQPSGMTCEALKLVATQINGLAYELHSDRLAYGQTILSLQQTIAKQRTLQAQNHAQPELSKNENNLNARLAVIKWLESPES